MFEKLYEDLYRKRAEVINLKEDEAMPLFYEDLVAEFDQKVKIYEMDEKFKKLEIDPFDVQDTLKSNTKAGVTNFWLRALLNHPNLSEKVSEKDRTIL